MDCFVAVLLAMTERNSETVRRFPDVDGRHKAGHDGLYCSQVRVV
jgi:hypothetical protein